MKIRINNFLFLGMNEIIDILSPLDLDCVKLINSEIETSFINNRYPDSEFDELNLSELIDTDNLPFDYIPYILIAKNILLNLGGRADLGLKDLVKSNYRFKELTYNYKNNEETMKNIFRYQMLIIKHYDYFTLDDMHKKYTKMYVNDKNQNQLTEIYEIISKYNENLSPKDLNTKCLSQPCLLGQPRFLNYYDDDQKNLLMMIKNKIDKYIKEYDEANQNSGIDKSIANIAEIHLIYIIKTNTEIFDYLMRYYMSDRIELSTKLDSIIERTFINQYNIIDKFVFGSM